jgi:hypothetical protein
VMEQVDRIFPISGGGVDWIMVGAYFFSARIFSWIGVEASLRTGVLRGRLSHFLTTHFFCLVGMASVWDADSVSDTGIMGCGHVEGDPKPPVIISLGCRAVNSTDLVNALTSSLDSGIPSSIDMSYLSGLAY